MRDDTCLAVLAVCSSLILCVSLSDDTMLAGDCGNDLLFAIPVLFTSPFVSILLALILYCRYICFSFAAEFRLIRSQNQQNHTPHWTT